MTVARLVIVEEKDCIFEVQREEHWMDTCATYMVNCCQGMVSGDIL